MSGTWTKDEARREISAALLGEHPRAFFDAIDESHPCAPWLLQLLALLAVCDARGKAGTNTGDEEEAYLRDRLEAFYTRPASPQNEKKREEA